MRERRLKRRRRCSGGHSLLSTVFVVAGLISSRNNRGIPGQKRTLCSGSSSELITFLRRALSPLLFHVRLSVNDTRRQCDAHHHFSRISKVGKGKKTDCGRRGQAVRGQIMTDRLEAKKEKNLNSPQLQEQWHPLFEGNLEGSNMG